MNCKWLYNKPMTNLIFKHAANKMRRAWGENDARRDANKTIPESIEVFDNISYGPHGKWNTLAVYRPKTSAGPLPCIVVFHGGGFFYGTKETYQFYSADLASRGFTVLCFNYRLCPEHRYPAQYEDINNVMLWIAANAEKYGIDINSLFFVGDSAGGSLVYTFSAIVTNQSLAKHFKFTLSSITKPKAIALNCSLSDFDLAVKTDSQQETLLKAYLGMNGLKKYKEQLNINNYVTQDFPATYVMSASHDFLLYQFQPTLDLLKEKGVKAEGKVYGSPDDQSAIHVFHVDVGSQLADLCNDDEVAFFKSFI